MAIGSRIQAAPGKGGTYQPMTGSSNHKGIGPASSDAYGKSGVQSRRRGASGSLNFSKTASQKTRMNTLV